MSLARPFFFFDHPSRSQLSRDRRGGSRDFFDRDDDSLWNWSNVGNAATVPAIDLQEHEHEYVVEAELPGLKKENVDIKVGDNGQSLTISGNSEVSRSTASPEAGRAAVSSTPAKGELRTCSDARSVAYIAVSRSEGPN